jgi:AcrR family transcriptional regulator
MRYAIARAEHGVRRQERGRRRIAQILDAAEAVIGESGFEAATTNAIASRAGISPGSLYQFFGNKEEILDALAERYVDHSAEFWDTQLAQQAAQLSLDRLVDRVLDALAAFKTTRPAFWVLFHGSAASPRLEAVAEEVRRGIARRLCALLALRAPGADPQRLERAARISIATVQGVFPLVMAAEPQERPAVVDELKALLRGYLAPIVGEGPQVGATGATGVRGRAAGP